MRWIVGAKAAQRAAASPSQMGRFEMKWLAADKNLSTLTDLCGQWITRDHDAVRRQMAVVAVPRNLFTDALRLIAELRHPPATSTAYGVRLSCVRSNSQESCVLIDAKSANLGIRLCNLAGGAGFALG